MYIQYEDQKHKMWLEGTSDTKPFKKKIMDHAKEKGFKASNIDIYFDYLQGIYRFTGEITTI